MIKMIDRLLKIFAIHLKNNDCVDKNYELDFLSIKQLNESCQNVYRKSFTRSKKFAFFNTLQTQTPFTKLRLSMINRTKLNLELFSMNSKIMSPKLFLLI